MDLASPVSSLIFSVLPAGPTKQVTGMHFVWEDGVMPQPATGRTTLFSSTVEKVRVETILLTW